ncbi:MAG: hypothetical protein COC06_11755, partial [Bacteroidales bacterium]
KSKKTTILKNINKRAKKLLRKNKFIRMQNGEKYLLCSLEQDSDIQSALFSVDPKTNDIVAFVGGTDFGKSQFNRVTQALRQPGSSFKPLLFAAALENNYTASSIIIDSMLINVFFGSF